MRIAVCIKQVPASETKVISDGIDIKRDNVSYVVNPYDEFGVEEALRVKEKSGGGEVVVFTIGAQKAEEALRTCLAMGADRAVRIDNAGLGILDSFNVATLLSSAIKKFNPDIIFTGKQAIDDDSGAVGIQLAELLGIPHAAPVVKLEIADGKGIANRQVEGGAEEVIQVSLPALFTCQKGLNEPRYASLPGIMKAKSKPLAVETIESLGINKDDLKACMTVSRLLPPPQRGKGKVFEGEDAVKELVRCLREEAKVI